MKQINNGFDPRYYLTEDGLVYDHETGNHIQLSKEHHFSLLTTKGKKEKVFLKILYRTVYNENFCIDKIEDLEDEH